MPFSQSGQISTIVGYAERVQPFSVLDVGAGMGQYGFLLRTNLEHLNLFQIDNGIGSLRPRSQWKRRIDGIEGFPVYLTPVHDYAYNEVFVGEALQILRSLPSGSYELVLAIDILEHFAPADGLTFLAELMRVSSRSVLVSTPKAFMPQDIEANPLENHRSHWTQTALLAQGFDEILDDEVSWIVAVDRGRSTPSGPSIST